jgi:hypothetical protein
MCGYLVYSVGHWFFASHKFHYRVHNITPPPPAVSYISPCPVTVLLIYFRFSLVFVFSKSSSVWTLSLSCACYMFHPAFLYFIMVIWGERYRLWCSSILLLLASAWSILLLLAPAWSILLLLAPAWSILLLLAPAWSILLLLAPAWCNYSVPSRFKLCVYHMAGLQCHPSTIQRANV